MNLKKDIPQHWALALREKDVITEESVALFGKDNLTHHILSLNDLLKKYDLRVYRNEYENVLESIQKLKKVKNKATAAPLFPCFRNKSNFKDDERVYFYANGKFTVCSILFTNLPNKEMMINSEVPGLPFKDRFFLHTSPNVLPASDFEFLKANLEYACIWFQVAYSESTYFDIKIMLGALLNH